MTAGRVIETIASTAQAREREGEPALAGLGDVGVDLPVDGLACGF